MADGTTLCPHCATRFRIAGAQLSSHQGMVRCGHCREAFDARQNYQPDQPSPQLDLLTEETDSASLAEQHSPGAQDAETLPTDATESYPVESTPSSLSGHEAGTDDAASVEDTPPTEIADTSLTAHAIDTAPDSLPEHVFAASEIVADEPKTWEVAEQEEAPPARQHTWLWTTGVLVLTVLLLAQSAYFFRIGLAAHMPALKPALVAYCHLLGCSVVLPQQPELLSIESSSLSADPDHENQVNLDALLRNRGGYAQSFPALSLTLNDMQDKPLARRNFLPADYLPAEENETRGLSANHEVSIRLRMDTAELRPVGYRLELYYPK